MSFDIQTLSLSEICTDISYGYTASANTEIVGPKFLRITDIQGGVVDWDTVPYCEIPESKLNKNLLSQGDIVVARTGNSTGENYMFSGDEPSVFASYLIRFKVDSNIANPHYVWLQMRTKRWWDFVSGAKSGSAQAGANATVLGKFEVTLPPKNVQDYVVDIISCLSSKISLNTSTNQTLEEMAQAIFKSWFVDFDPVKAKMNGEQPEGMDVATASLFPEKLVESELGLIPEGWAIKPIKDLCTKVQNGGTPKRNEKSYWDDGTIPWLTSGEVRQSIITAVENRITQLGLDKSSAKWVPELSTLVALYGATAGEVSLTSIPLTTNQAVCALMPKKEHQWYNYLQLKNRVAELAGKAVGSAQQNISKGLVESTEVLSVPESLLEAFNSQVENLFRLRICNLNENVELAKLRDTLLPKLLSGEIELGQAQELAEVE
ncbi:restriction endonuclease subunit S [Vibrio alginolyticus]|uniref:restriction endonuclease subunit S n=1 Tax=Vibrio alginolyticus TaxID=663 RepID=UPI003D7CF7BB